MLLVQHFLEHSAARSPDKIALVCDGSQFSYGELDKMANRLAHALREQGVQRGDRVVLCLANSVELVVGIFAAMKAEGVFVVIYATTKTAKLLGLVRDCRATALILPAGRRAAADSICAGAPSVKCTVLTGKPGGQEPNPPGRYLHYDTIQAAYPDSQPACHLIDQDLACLIYTSGSTGLPKGVMSGHNNVVFAASSIISYLKNQPEDIVFNGLPLSFDYGLYQLLMVFKFGGTLVLERSITYPAQILKLLEKEKVTGLPGVPTLFAILLQMDLSPYDLSSLRYISNTAAALPTRHIRAIREKFNGVTLYSMYGLTETKRTLYLPPAQLDIRPDSVGIAIPGTEVWIEDQAGNRLGANLVGELVIRGGHVMRGYWDNPQATAARYRPGLTEGERHFYSGDLFYRDEEGYHYFVGRKDDMIKSRGEKVSPQEIEKVLYDLPGIAEAAVIGVADPLLGQAIKAFIVPVDGTILSEKEVLRHCRAHLEDYLVPQLIEFREALPKNLNGKIQKSELLPS